MRTGATSVTSAGANTWNVAMAIAHDNDNPSTFRAWWHVEIANIDPAQPTTLNFSITNMPFGDAITPVWSLDGGVTYSRINAPANATSFSVTVPAGIDTIRIGRWFPYTLPMYAAFQDRIRDHPFVTETVSPQQTTLGNHLYMYEITDHRVPPAGKPRVWIHSAVHPSENTAHFQTEGLIDFLLGGSLEANVLLRHVIFNIVPVANPDGVERGNYRTNANSINLENEWTAPYNSTWPEIVFMRTQIEGFMGTADNVGANPITVLFNLHASHGALYPFHFVHRALWNQPGDQGVKQSVRDLEDRWVSAYRGRSPYVDLGNDQFSSLVGRPFVESMMHDRYSIQPQWEDAMAITFEGVYQRGPISGVPGTAEDYRQIGLEMGLAIGDYLGIEYTVDGEMFLLF